jgi:hypothetical protein
LLAAISAVEAPGVAWSEMLSDQLITSDSLTESTGTATGPKDVAAPRPRGPLLMAGPIESRGLSAKALRIFTDSLVPGEHLQAANDAAVAFLQRRRAELRQQADELIDVVDAEEDPGSNTVDTRAKLDMTMRSFSLVEADLKCRREQPYMTTRDVHKYIIKPATDARLCRFVELSEWAAGLDNGGRSFVGLSDYFVSHSWDTGWLELLEAIEAHQAAHSDEPYYYWVDIFAVCQHWRTDTGSADSPGHMPAACGLGCLGCSKVAEDMHDWATADPANPKGFEQGATDRGFRGLT